MRFPISRHDVMALRVWPKRSRSFFQARPLSAAASWTAAVQNLAEFYRRNPNNRRQCFETTLALVVMAFCLAGCQTVAPITCDFSEPDWNVQRGQAVWKSSASADEIAGELLVATHPNGRAVVEFSKPPISFVTVVIRNGAWSVSSPLRGRFSGLGAPPPGILWMQLPQLIGDGRISSRWKLTRDGAENWSLAHETSGEVLTGFLAP